jgi:tetratricopeptide (TPR) repeat protein
MCIFGLLVHPLIAEERLNVSDEYQRIAADYQRIVAATDNSAARAAAGRLTRDGYRRLVDQVKGIEGLSADDLHALGQCHEALDETDKARELYARSLAAAPQARTHLSLTRVSLDNDLKAADEQFAKAAELQADHPDLQGFRLALAEAHQRGRDWNGAVAYLESLLAYTKTLADGPPANANALLSHLAIQKELDRVRRFAGMTDQAAAPLNVQQWAQGEPAELAALQGKVVLVDFCAIWAEPSRARIGQLKELHAKFASQGLEIVSVSLAYQHKYDEAADEVVYEKDLPPKDEAAALATFAKKHEMTWRIGLIGRETIEQYGVGTLPHTVAIDKQGNVSAIILGGDQADEDLPAIVMDLLK